jgi:aspartate/methionine/tyrosine aminotransferase
MTGFFAEEDLSPNPIETARLRQAAGAGYIDLTSSNPTRQGLLFPEAVLRHASAPYWQTRHYQPDPKGTLAARTAISHYYAGRTPALTLDPEQIFITASTSEAYSHLFALLTQPGDNILGPQVTYPLFEYLAAIHHVELRPYTLVESEGWQIDDASLLAQSDERTRAVLLISPHNPTGMVVTKPNPMLDKLGLPVICDEVFSEFSYRLSAVPPFSSLHPHLPVFLLNGISKMFALPDMKLGWIALNDLAYQIFGERLELLNDTFLSCSSLIQTMLPTLFSEGADFVRQMHQHIKTNLDMALEMLNRSQLFQMQPPDGGYYLFVGVPGWQQDEEALVLYLLEQGVLVHPGFFYNYEGESENTATPHLMISALTETTQLQAGLAKLVAALA